MRATTATATLGRQTYVNQCAACHGDTMQGGSGFPPLLDMAARRTAAQVADIVLSGQGRMPAFSALPTQTVNAVVQYVMSGEAKEPMAAEPSPIELKYNFSGYHKFYDPDGYPAVVPPWGTLNAINLNTGEYAWKIPLGEYPELAAQGIKDTGTENYGGPLVTAGGLGIHRRDEFRQEVPRLRQRHWRLIVGNHDDQFGECDAGHLSNRGNAVCGHPGIWRLRKARASTCGRRPAHIGRRKPGQWRTR